MCQNSVAPCEGCSAALKHGRHGEAWRSGGGSVWRGALAFSVVGGKGLQGIEEER